MTFKTISGISFFLAFTMAVVLFTGTGSQYVSIHLAKILFLFFGALAFVFNLISYKKGKHIQTFNLLYWTGSLVLFIGLAVKILHGPYSSIVLLFGAGILGTSFLIPNKLKRRAKDENLLDDF